MTYTEKLIKQCGAGPGGSPEYTCMRLYLQPLPGHLYKILMAALVFSASLFFQLSPSCDAILAYGFWISSACFFSAPLVFPMFAYIVFSAFAFLPIHVFPTLARADLHSSQCLLIVLIVFACVCVFSFPVLVGIFLVMCQLQRRYGQYRLK